MRSRYRTEVWAALTSSEGAWGVERGYMVPIAPSLKKVTGEGTLCLWDDGAFTFVTDKRAKHRYRPGDLHRWRVEAEPPKVPGILRSQAALVLTGPVSAFFPEFWVQPDSLEPWLQRLRWLEVPRDTR